MCAQADGVVQLHIRPELIVARFPAPLLDRRDERSTDAGLTQLGRNPPSLDVRDGRGLAALRPWTKREGDEAARRTVPVVPNEDRFVGEVVAIGAGPERSHHLGHFGHLIGAHETDGHGDPVREPYAAEGAASTAHWKQSVKPSGSFTHSCFMPYDATVGGDAATPRERRCSYKPSTSWQPK